MLVALHATLLLALPIIALVALLLLKRRPPSDSLALRALAWTVLACFVAWASNQHLCQEGNPRMQWGIPALFQFSVLQYMASTKWRRVVAGVLIAGMLGLSCHFSEVVHQPGWTGNPRWDGGAGRQLRMLRVQARQFAVEAADPTVEIPRGWFRETSIWQDVRQDWSSRLYQRREVSRTWHTWWTGLYRYREVPVDIWYEGGPLKEVADGLTLRDVAGQSTRGP